MSAAAATPSAAVRTEALRKSVHVSCLLFALLLRWLPWKGALLLAAGSFVFNFALLPRFGGDSLLRAADRERGVATGILLYPASLVLLVLVFRDRLELVGAGWALMALGDGMASVVGTTAGRHRLPWNRSKSWEGLLAHAIFGGIGAAWLMGWIGGLPLAGLGWSAVVATGVLLPAALGAAFVTAWLESLDSGVDDNLVVPLAGAGVAWLLLELLRLRFAVDWSLVGDRSLVVLVACAALGVAAWAARSLAVSGALAAVVVGVLVGGVGGWSAFAVLAAFFVLGTVATRLGRRVKEARGIAEERGGRRAAGNVLANGGLAAAAALLLAPGLPEELRGLAGLVFAAGLATATFDTVSSEIGKAWGRQTVLVTTGRPVPAGTEGAVSLEGTAAGGLAAVLVGLLAFALGLLPSAPGLVPAAGTVLAVACGAFVGTTFESIVGAWSSSRGREIDNDVLNFANTVVGGLSAVFLHLL